MTCDTADITFDISSSAGLYSQLAGVLAAFAFGAITLVLPGQHRGGNEPHDDRSDLHVLVALVSAFISLVIASIEYAGLAGEKGCALLQGRAASKEFLSVVAFAFAILLLLYAVAQLVTHSRVAGINYHIRLIVTVLGAPLALLFILIGAEDVASTPWRPAAGNQPPTPHDSAFYHWMTNIFLPWPAAMGLLCVVVWILGRRRRRMSPDDHDIDRPSRARLLFPYVSLGLSVMASVRSTILADTDPASRIQPWEVWIWLALCAAVLLCQAILLAFARGVERS